MCNQASEMVSCLPREEHVAACEHALECAACRFFLEVEFGDEAERIAAERRESQ